MPDKNRPSEGLVDHDARLRHQLLGAFQILCASMVPLTPLVALATPGPLDRRVFIPTAVLALGTLAQHLLWRMRKDRIVSRVIVASLVSAMAVGMFVNGVRAPSSVIPLLAVLLAGYLLGRKSAWRVGCASLLLLAAGTFADRLGWLPAPLAPEGVWTRVVAIQIAVSAGILAIPLRGLLSGVERIDREKAALEASVESLERHRNRLTREIARRTRDLELANSDLSVFSFVLSHDLRTPLRTIRGMAEALRSSPDLTAAQRDLLDRIAVGSTRLDRDLQTALENAPPDRSP